MRHILRQRELTADSWRYLGEAAAAADALIIPLEKLRADPESWRQRPGALGVRLSPADAVEELAPLLPGLALIAVEFPNTADGRGYTQARLLRERFGFRGELRAVGNGVRQDLVFFMARCGFDAFELAEGEDPQAARRALQRYDVAYQPGSPAVALRAQRFLSR
jgi:uncharacterized protein (DUF934 family)